MSNEDLVEPEATPPPSGRRRAGGSMRGAVSGGAKALAAGALSKYVPGAGPGKAGGAAGIGMRAAATSSAGASQAASIPAKSAAAGLPGKPTPKPPAPGARNLVDKAREVKAGTTGSGSEATAAQKVREVGGDAAKGAAVGAVQGAAGGWVGAGVGAAKGAGMALAKNRNFRNVIIAITLLAVAAPIAMVLLLVLITSNMSSGIESANAEVSNNAVIESGEDGEFIATAMDLAKKSVVPWQIVAAIMRETGETHVDVKALEDEIQRVDPKARYRNLAAGAHYSQSSPTRLQAKDGESAEAAEKVKDAWSEAIASAIGVSEEDSDRIYDVALSWFLGQSFGPCDFLPDDLAGGSSMQFDEDQRDNAELIIAMAKGAFKTRSGSSAAASAAIVASIVLTDLRNIEDETAALKGLFAQLAPSGDDPAMDQRTVRTHTVGSFYRALNAIDGWQDMSAADLADRVLGTSNTDEYAAWEAFANKNVSANWSHVQPDPMPATLAFTPIERDQAEDNSTVTMCAGSGMNYLGDVIPPMLHDTYTVTSEFGPRDGKLHAGIDLASPCGVTIYAAIPGTVSVATRSSGSTGYGTWVEVVHEDGLKTRYGHMLVNSLQVKVGDVVSAGQQIGQVGNTGHSYGCHLHFETYVNGKPLDPRLVFLVRGVVFKALRE